VSFINFAYATLVDAETSSYVMLMITTP